MIGRSYQQYLLRRSVITEEERYLIDTARVRVRIIPAVPPQKLTRYNIAQLRKKYDEEIQRVRRERELRQQGDGRDHYGRTEHTTTKGLTRAEVQARMQARVETAARMCAEGKLTIASLCEATGVTNNVASIAIREAKCQGLIPKTSSKPT